MRGHIGNFRAPASLTWVLFRWSKTSVDPAMTPLWSIPPVINVWPLIMVTIDGYQRPTSIGVIARTWRTVDHVEAATAEWVDWFNHRRLCAYCGDLPPAKMEGAYYAQIKAQPFAELSNRKVSGHVGTVHTGSGGRLDHSTISATTLSVILETVYLLTEAS